MKKFLAALLTLMLVLGMSISAFADDPAAPQDAEEVTITKSYKAANGGVSPAEEFSFSALECTSVTDAAEGVTAANAPVPEIGTVSFAAGDATAAGTEKTATITLPEYTSVGVYTYTFTEDSSAKTAGVTYFEDEITLVVTVIEQDGKVRVAAVHCEGSDGTEKTDKFENIYESGTLEVTKEVTGNMGDQSKYFDVTVTFTPADGETINSTIKYSGGSKYASEVTVENNRATIQVKHGDSVTFTNIPEGVTWAVEEADYRGDGYDAAQYSKATDTMGAGTAAACTITNNKENEIDTGISMDSLPYIVRIAVVVIAAAAFFMKRRNSAE